MEKKLQKPVSVLLALLMMMSVMLCVPISTEAAESDECIINMLDEMAEKTADTPLLFSGGKIYWQIPEQWVSKTKVAYAHVYGHNGEMLHYWQTRAERMTNEGDNIWSYEIPAGPYDLVVFSIDSGAQTHDLVLTDKNIGMTAISDTGIMIENPMDSYRTSARTTWRETGGGVHLAITSTGNIVGEELCPTENSAELVASFIKSYLPYNPEIVTKEVLDAAMEKSGATAEEIVEVLENDPDFTMLSEAKVLLGVAEIFYYEDFGYIERDDGTLELVDCGSGATGIGFTYDEIDGKVIASIADSVFSDWYDLNELILPKRLVSIGKYCCLNCPNLKEITIPQSVESIGEYALGYIYEKPSTDIGEDGNPVITVGGYKKVDGLTIYGYAGTAAESYANDNGFTFINVSDQDEITHTDEKTNISVTVKGDSELSVKPLEDEDTIDRVTSILKNGETLVAIFDISLMKDGVVVQPDGMATVKIPTVVINARVYRIELDGTTTNMDAVYEDGYLVFTTEHFSEYAVVAPSEKMMGDVDGNGKITIADAVMIQKHIAHILTLSDEQCAVADVDENGKITVADAVMIQKYIANVKK